jgi:hypothetical protein
MSTDKLDPKRTGRSCGTCALARGFRMTPTGRFAKNTVSACMYEIAVPVLPASVRQSYRDGHAYPKGYVAPSDGAGCPVFVPKK